MRQQFAGPLGSSVAMQMPALHFTLGPVAATTKVPDLGLFLKSGEKFVKWKP